MCPRVYTHIKDDFGIASNSIGIVVLRQQPDIGLAVRVFANGPGDLAIPGRVIPKTQKITLSIIRYGSRVKWSNPGKGVAIEKEPSGHPRLWSTNDSNDIPYAQRLSL